MPFIKKMVMHGFKSFARRTEIPFENAMNVIVGPNGSGKSNVTDALCFVLGRLSIKSMRAAKAANLCFSGNSKYKGSQEATVELSFDNSDKVFAIDSDEVTIRRTVRKNGQSIYKINNETKTRQEILELLAQAGIDPNGFNIVLQGEIASLIKSTPEERRKIIEEVAGISIYETRKHKSIRELEKTEEKIKEVSAVLRERNSYLKNLEKEKQDAINHQKYDLIIKRCKTTILDKSLKEKQKENLILDNEIENQEKEIQKIKKQISQKNSEVEELQQKVNEINKKIQSQTSNEQDTLHKEIAELKAEIAGLQVREENFTNRLQDNKQRIEEIEEKIEDTESELEKLKSSSPELKQQHNKLKSLQKEFDDLEKKRRRFYVLKSEISTLKNKREEKNKSIIEQKKELELIERNIQQDFDEIKYVKSIEQATKIKKESQNKIQEIEIEIENINKNINENEKKNAVFEQDILREERLKQDITKLDICPLCKSKVTKEHTHEVTQKSDKKIKEAKRLIEENEKLNQKATQKLEELQLTLNKLKTKINEIDIDIIKIKNSEQKKEQIKNLYKNIETYEQELRNTNKEIEETREEFESLKNIEEKYDDTRLRLQELSFAEIDVDSEVSMKQRDSSRLSNDLKSLTRDIEESESELKKIIQQLTEKNKIVENKEKEEQELYERFNKFFSDRNELQDKQKVIETDIIGHQHTARSHEDKINQIKINKAQINAQIDSLKTELNEVSEGGKIEIFTSTPIEKVKQKLQDTQFRISRLGNVNMKALEVYEKVEEQCKSIQEKVDTINQEKEKIEKIIAEIDKKKKRAFIQTLEAVNKYFTRNFTQLSKKGEVFLELEDKKDPFNGGLNILIKVSRGKYFDITSLSGGEKTLVALSLIFAIQEYKPYCFYVFDEIDAALDKHNSELLAALIKRYMTTGQYIIVTHNDALISEASTLYGVSMQENISKIISLKI